MHSDIIRLEIAMLTFMCIGATCSAVKMFVRKKRNKLFLADEHYIILFIAALSTMIAGKT